MESQAQIRRVGTDRLLIPFSCVKAKDGSELLPIFANQHIKRKCVSRFEIAGQIAKSTECPKR